MFETAPPEACHQAIPEAPSKMDDTNTSLLSSETTPSTANTTDTASETLPAVEPVAPKTIPDAPGAPESSLLPAADNDEDAAATTAIAPAPEGSPTKPVAPDSSSTIREPIPHDTAAEPQPSFTTQVISAPVAPVNAVEVLSETTTSNTVGHATSNLDLELASLQPSSGPTEDKTQLTAGKHASTIANDKAHTRSATDGKPTSTVTEAKKEPKGKEPATERKPLQLLELPVDILQLIFQEVGHSNDLAAIAKTCSTLYALAIPCLYASFDIVWSNSMSIEPGGRSVDALTYGLSTICLGSSFARTMHRLRARWFRHGPNQNRPPPPGTLSSFARTHPDFKFTGNDYAKYIRKFSLGNGPSNDVGKYNVRRGQGKMLGTLAALSIAKMCNLETFIWDMPAGIQSDVFMALASLPEFYPDTRECKLEHVWVRWHNNSIRFDDSPPDSRSSTPGPPRPPGMGMPVMPRAVRLNFVMQGSTMTDIGIQIPPNSSHPPPNEPISYGDSDVQFPTFSVVPPVKSLTVLDIDHISYLDELSILIHKSHARLEELRIGIASHVASEFFVQSWDSPDLKQVDESSCFYGDNQIGERRLGGVMGILVGHLFDLRRHINATNDEDKAKAPEVTADAATQAEVDIVAGASVGTDQPPGPLKDNGESRTSADSGGADTVDAAAESNGESVAGTTAAKVKVSSLPSSSTDHTQSGRPSDAGGIASTPIVSSDAKKDEGTEEQVSNKRLKLTTLELERVPLSYFTMASALDWSTITSLTLLGCPSQEGFWRHLRKHFRPTPVASVPPRPWWNPGPRKNYQLSLKSIHTDNVRKSLLLFIKETLWPNSLDTLLLHRQYNIRAQLKVTIDDVFKNAVKPHYKSLRKLMINGDQREYSEADDSDDTDEFNRESRDWDLPRDIITFITSGRMRELQELSFSLSYSDWHPFLQMLPGLPHLTALHIQNISQHVIREFSPAESAMQIADIVTLRMEMKLSYVATATKCYELIEVIKAADGSELFGPGERSRRGSIDNLSSSSSAASDSDDDSNNGHNNDDSDSDDDNDVMVLGAEEFGEEMDDEIETSRASNSDAEDEHVSSTLRLSRVRLSEIFFFDDKVTIFKTRRGRL